MLKMFHLQMQDAGHAKRQVTGLEAADNDHVLPPGTPRLSPTYRIAEWCAESYTQIFVYTFQLELKLTRPTAKSGADSLLNRVDFRARGRVTESALTSSHG